MNASTNLGVISIVLYFLVVNYVHPIPHSVAVPMILVFSSIGSFLTSVVYSYTIDGHSIPLFICCAIGGSVGSLASVIMNPFLTKFKNDFISASRSGGSICILFSALLALIQSPGSKNIRFSTKIYMIVFGLILACPIFAYMNIVLRGIGLRDDGSNDNESKDYNNNDIEGKTEDYDIDNLGSKRNRRIADEEDICAGGLFKFPILNNQNHIHKSQYNPLVDSLICDLSPDNSETDNDNNDLRSINTNKSNGNFKIEFDDLNKSNDTCKCIEYFIPKFLSDKYPWIINVAPICLVVGFVNFNTWGMVTALSPFAFNNVSGESGPVMLGLAYQLGAVMLVLGDLSTTLFHIPIYINLSAFTIFTGTLYLAAMDLPIFDTPFAGALLVICFGFGRFFEANLVTSAYREIATDNHPSDRENAARAVGLTDQFSTTIGSLISTLLVAKYGNC
jgi:hypothetical protein